MQKYNLVLKLSEQDKIILESGTLEAMQYMKEWHERFHRFFNGTFELEEKEDWKKGRN